MGLLDDIRLSFAVNSNPLRKIIAVNVAVFLLIGILNLLAFLFGTEGEIIHTISRYGMLPASFSNLLTQPWSLLTYMFMHDSFFHILFNMLWLFWIGNILYEYLGGRKVLEVYFLAGILGGMVYMIAYNIFPAFKPYIPTTFAIGASASVLGIIFATATLLPNYTIQLLFFGGVKLKWLALVSLALDLISIPNGNAGGHIAHIGGALIGFLYIKYIYSVGGNVMPDAFWNLFSGRRKPSIYYKSAKQNHAPSNQEEVDAILDKISKSGYDSLTKKEKETLFKASKE